MVDEEADGVVAGAGEDGEEPLHLRLVVPDPGLEIEGVGQRDLVAQQVQQLRLGAVGQRRELQAQAVGQVGGHGHVAARAAGHQHTVARQGAEDVQRLQRLHQLGQRAAARDAQALEERVVEPVGTAERGGVAQRRLGRGLRAAGLDDGQRHPPVARPLGRGDEAGEVAQRLDVEPDGGDARVLQQLVDQMVLLHAGLVADGDEVAQRQFALLRHQRDRDGAGLADQRHAPRHRLAADLVGPDRHAVEEIDEAEAVGPEEGQRARRRLELRVEFVAACRLRLGEAGGEADRAAGAQPRGLRQRRHRQLAVDAQHHAVRHLGQRGQRAVIGLHRRAGPRGMHAVEPPGVAQAAALDRRHVAPGSSHERQARGP